jgi:DNA topoisomerase-1
MRRLVIHYGDQVFPVPLDADLLRLAEESEQTNIIQDIYRIQEERNQYRSQPFTDSRDMLNFRDDYDPNEKRDESGKWTEGGGGSKAKATRSSAATAHLVYAPNREAWPEHIRKLVIPPAWTDTKISMDPKKPLQVTGKDVKGHTQYRYLDKFRQSQDAIKYKRVMALNNKHDRLTGTVNKDLTSDDAHKKEHAFVTKLIMETGLRPGSEKDTGADQQAYGATTLNSGHIVTDGNGVCLEFVGKKGVSNRIPVHNKQLADELKKRAKRGGQLFPTVNDNSLRRYVASLAGGGFKTKDLRTLKATRIANELVQSQKPPTSMKQYKEMVKEVAVKVSKQLGNTPTVALQSYINPMIFAPWQVT